MYLKEMENVNLKKYKYIFLFYILGTISEDNIGC